MGYSDGLNMGTLIVSYRLWVDVFDDSSVLVGLVGVSVSDMIVFGSLTVCVFTEGSDTNC